MIKNPPANEGGTGDAASIPGLGRSSAGGMATHSSILAWRIPWTEEPGGLQSMGPQRVGITEGLSTHTHLAHHLDLSIRLYSQSVVICCFDLYLWRSPYEWRGGTRHCSRVMVVESGLNTMKKDTRGLSRVAAGNPVFPRLVPVTSGSFSGCL